MLSSAILVAGLTPPDPADQLVAGRESAAGLIPVLDRPLIVHAAEELVSVGVGRIVVVADRTIAEPVAEALETEVLAAATVDVVERDPATPLAAAIAHARPLLDYGPFILRFGDSLSNGALAAELDFEAGLDDFDALAMTCRFEIPEDEPSVKAGNGLDTETGEFHVGMYAVGRRFPIAIPSGTLAKAPSAMDAALEWMEQRGGRVERRLIDGWWRHRGQPDACLTANRFKLSGLRESEVLGTVLRSDVEGPVICHPTARVESSVIRGPASIAADAVITDAFVGPFSSIGRGARVDGAEIENSVVLEESIVAGIGPRLDSSVIGPRASIMRDFRIPRGTRINVGSGASVAF